MAKKRPLMKVADIFKESTKDLAEKQGRTLVDVTEDIGKQMQYQLKSKPDNFTTTFTLPDIKLKERKKKGGVLDIIFVLVMLLVVSMSFLFLYTAWVKIEPKAQVIVSSSADANQSLAYASSLANSLDNIFLIFFIFMIIAVVILSFQVQFHPIFYFLFVIVIAFGLMASVAFSNTYEKVQDTTNVNDSIFTVQNYVMNNLPGFFLGMSLLALIAIYVKIRSGGG